MNRVYLCLGSNTGDRLGYLARAVSLIDERIGEVDSLSMVYETEPWGMEEVPWFFNQVARVKTSLMPEELLEALENIEKSLGREKKKIYASRTIDIDILFYADALISTENLSVPHAFMHLRKFMLMPMAEIAPDFVHPIFGETIATLLAQCEDTNIVVPFISQN